MLAPLVSRMKEDVATLRCRYQELQRRRDLLRHTECRDEDTGSQQVGLGTEDGGQECWQPPASPDTPGMEEPEPSADRIAAHRRDNPKVAGDANKIWPTSAFTFKNLLDMTQCQC